MVRRPKRLADPPNLFLPSGGGPVVIAPSVGRDARSGAADRQRTNPATSDEHGTVSVIDAVATAVDAEVRREAHRLVRRLQIEAPWDTQLRRGGADPTRVPWDGRGGDVDVDRMLESIVPGRRLRDEEIVVRRPMTRSRSVVLLIDVSGSMKGERIKTTAAALGSLLGGLANDTVGITAFWSDAAVVVPMGQQVSPEDALDMVLDIEARGLTNVGFGLTTAQDELDGWPPDAARVVVLSDCVHNAGPDPRPLAVGGPRVDVLLDTSEEHDEVIARDLARATSGRYESVVHADDVPRALARLFDS